MKYVAIFNSEKGLSEEAVEALKDTMFLGDENTPYCMELVSIVEAPTPMEISLCGEYGYKDTQTTKHIKEGYNQALRDCGVSE